jgi:PPOX class probable F420-dependent enzyme
MGALTMTKQEREDFLAGTHVGVLAVNADGGSPVVTPIWYSYERDGDVTMSTGVASNKTVALRDAGHASLCVQTEAAPYQYVVVEGPVAITDGVDSDWRRGLARRYLGAELGDAYIESTIDQERTSVTVRLSPQKWRTTDYNKLF